MKNKQDFKVSVVIPCFNEKETIRQIIDMVRAAPFAGKEIIVVDDFSQDGTREILKEELEPLVSKVLYHDKNRGKGAAVSTGLAAVTGDVVIIQDADLEYDPADYEKLLSPIKEGKADVVYGSRFLGGEPHRVLFFWHYVGNRFLTTLSNIFTNLNLTDMETGYKVLRADVAARLILKEPRFGFDPEITAKAAKLKCRFFEVGISYNGRTYEEGKKIGWRDGIRVVWCILRYNLLG